MLSVLAKSSDFENLVNCGLFKEIKNMCEVIEKIKSEGQAEAVIETIINHIMSTTELDLYQTMDLLEVFQEERKNIYLY